MVPPVAIDVFALIVATVAAIAAVGAWLQTVESAADSKRSADAAEASAEAARRTVHIAEAPDVAIQTDGHVRGPGLGLTVTSDKDVDSLRIVLLHEPLQMHDRDGLALFNQFYMDRMGGTGVTFGNENGEPFIVITNVRAGETYWVSLVIVPIPSQPALYARAQFRVIATVANEGSWTLARSIPRTALRAG